MKSNQLFLPIRRAIAQKTRRIRSSSGLWGSIRLCCMTAMALLLSGTASYSQSPKQVGLVTAFFTDYGQTIVHNMAHPQATCSGSSVEAFRDNVYFITLSYQGDGKYFSCQYRLKLDDAGHFSSLSIHNCGGTDRVCFLGCRLFASFDQLTSAYNRKRYEDYLGKSLDDMHCEEYTLAKLYFIWVDKGYYAAY